MVDRSGEPVHIFQAIHVRRDLRIHITTFGKQVRLQFLTQMRLTRYWWKKT